MLGAPVAIRTENDPALAWSAVRDALDRGFAPVLSTDLRFLPYWKTSSPFNGHRVVLAGHDEGRGVALVADTERPELQEVLSPIWRGPAPPTASRSASPAASGWRLTPRRRRFAGARRLGTRSGGRPGRCCSPRTGSPEPPGWSGSRPRFRTGTSWPATRPTGPGASDSPTSASRRRGTGGGNFRLLYARFLAEAALHHPGVAALGLPARMAEIAAFWTRLANSYKDLSERPGERPSAAVAAQVLELAGAERRYHEDVAARVSG